VKCAAYNAMWRSPSPVGYSADAYLVAD